MVLFKKRLETPAVDDYFCSMKLYLQSFDVTECWYIEFVVSVFTAKRSPSEGLSTGVQLTLATAKYLRLLPAGIPVIVYDTGRRVALLLRVVGANVAHPDFVTCVLFEH